MTPTPSRQGTTTAIGFLHTSAEHVEPFRALVETMAPGTSVIDVVDDWVLERAQVVGPRHLEILGAVADRLAQLYDAHTVVCTCSTIGEVAEEIGAVAGMNVIRVDRPMVERAVEIAAAGSGRIAVLATTDSAVNASKQLFDSVMLATGANHEVTVELIDDAWAHFTSNDLERYHAIIAEAIVAAADRADVIVLAQASMAAAAALVDVESPVLTSPSLAIESIVATF